MTAGDAGAGKKLGTAPVGPPPDLVQRRGHEPAEAPHGNLPVSHVTTNSPSSDMVQGLFPTDLTDQTLLTLGLSDPRLQRFAAAAKDDGVAREDTYLWNLALAESFHLPLHMAEVTCRNTIHSALLFRDPAWHKNRIFRQELSATLLRDLDQAVADETDKHGDAMTCHHLVSALSFGFWQYLATDKMKRLLFPKGIKKNFKGAPDDAKPPDLYNLIESVRLWRNRIAHHNAIFDKGPASKYQDALKLISWTSVDLGNWVSKRCKVNQVINNRPRSS